MASSITLDGLTGDVAYINYSDADDQEVAEELQRKAPEIRALQNWTERASGSAYGGRRNKGLFQQDQYVSPDNIVDKMRTASVAVREDDVVGGVADTTEQLAFKRVRIECASEREESIYDQVAQDIGLEQFCRQIWREVFTYSQAYPAVMWGDRTYKPTNRTESGNKSKKSYDVRVPTHVTLLDPLRVVPVGNFMFGQEQLAYWATPAQSQQFDNNFVDQQDAVLNQLVTKKYEPNDTEREEIDALFNTATTGYGGSASSSLYLLNPDNCFRITSTRPDYLRFAEVRMESVFELLDLKNLLREMDRQSLIGSTNAIILVKKGSDKYPAQSKELQSLSTQVQTTARNPIIVADHRVEIEIITPKTDKTLSAERYNGIDSRITSRLYQVLSTGNYASGTATDDSMKLLRVVASSMEARRDSIRDEIMTNIFRLMWKKNAELEDEPAMAFYPRRIALEFDPNQAEFMQALRDRGDLSRETMLAELDVEEDVEAVKREREKRLYDHVFSPVNVPYGAADGQEEFPGDPRKTGGRRKGGNNNGGGAPGGRKSGQESDNPNSEDD